MQVDLIKEGSDLTGEKTKEEEQAKRSLSSSEISFGSKEKLFEYFEENRKNDKYFKIKGISSVIGSMVFELGCSCSFPIGQLYIYLISYLHHYNPKVKIKHGYFFGPLMDLFEMIAYSFSGIIDNHIKCKYNYFIGVIVMAGGILVILISHNLYVDYVIYALTGFGLGLCKYIPQKNAVKYFPKQKGLIIGLVESSMNLGAFIFNAIGEAVINPHHIEPDEKDSIYEFKIAKKFRYYIIIQSAAYIGFAIISSFMLFTYDELKYGNVDELIENEKNKGKKEENAQELLSEGNMFGLDNPGNQTVMMNENTDSENLGLDLVKVGISVSEEVDPNYLKAALKSWRIIRLCIVVFLSIFIINVVQITYRPAAEKIIKEGVIQVAGELSYVVSCICLPLWGEIAEKVNYRWVLLFMNLGCVFTGFAFNSTLKKGQEVYYMIVYLFSMILFYEPTPTLETHVSKVYGIKYMLEIFGTIEIAEGSTIFCSALFSFLIETIFTNKRKAYKIMYLTGGGLAAAATLLGIFEDDTPFIYKKPN